MSPRRLLVLVATAVTLAAATTTATAAATPDYSSIVSQFMCVSCHEPLELVNSPQAISEKQTLQGLVAKGLDLSQIKAAMVSQYGSQVLARPPASGFNLTVYILPPALFVGGLALLAFTLPRWRARSKRAAASPPEVAPPLDADEAKRLEDELTNFM